MHAHNQWWRSIALTRNWRRKDGINRPAIHALVSNSLTLYQVECVLEDGIQLRKRLPVHSGDVITFIGYFPQPDIIWILVRVCEDKTLQVRCSREMGPVPLTDDKILDERCNCAIGFIHDANLGR